MAATPSVMIELGRNAPDFNLKDVVTDKNIRLQDIKSPVATVVMFICNHCPYVKHIIDKLVSTSKEYSAKGVSFVAISSNDIEQYPEDGPEEMKKWAIEKDFNFPYLYDESQDVARAYEAACTPDFFVFDKNLACVYRGQFDDSRPKNDNPITGKDLKKALDQILSGQPVDRDQKPSIGCNIKWKPAG
jgi:peroxiredoxin